MATGGADTDRHEAAEPAPGDEPIIDLQTNMVANAKRRHGALGVAIAAGMVVFDELLGRKVKDEAPIVVAAPTEPGDIDADGINLSIDEATSVVVPALPRTAPTVAARRRRRR